MSGDPDSGIYTVSCNLVTEEGVPVSCTYEGPLAVSGMPEPDPLYSTLTGDYALDLEGAVAEAYYYGDYYETGGGNWIIMLNPAVEGDGVQLEFVCEGLDFADGIAGVTYTASDLPSPGEYMEGYVNGKYLYGTWYTPVDASYELTGMAPAVGGTIEVANHGDGSYDIVFDCTDDKGYVWSGSWSGELAVTDYSSYSSLSAYSSESVKRFGKVLPSRGLSRAELIKSGGLEISDFQVHASN